MKTSKGSSQNWISFLDDRQRNYSAFCEHFEQISYKSFRLILICALIILLIIVIRSSLFGGPFSLADTANFVFLIIVYWLSGKTNIRWRPLAWLVFFSFFLNSIDGLIPLSKNPITPTHLLLPLLVFYGVILGVFSLSFVAAAIVIGVYFSTAILYWPLSHSDILKLSNLSLLTIFAATAAYRVYLYHKKIIKLLQKKYIELENELNINLRLLSVIYHDIVNPLSTILIATDLLSDEKNIDKYDIKMINVCAKRIFAIIHSVRNLNAANCGSINTKNIKISDILNELNDIFISRLKEKEQKFFLTEGYDLEVKTHLAIICNSVLGNLLSNAIKFSPRGASIEMSASIEGEFVRIEVNDKGKGFPKAMLEKIIKGEKYKSIPGTEEEEGHGDGLRIAAMYAQKLHGTLQIRNRKEGGATVAILLPAASEQDRKS